MPPPPDPTDPQALRPRRTAGHPAAGDGSSSAPSAAWEALFDELIELDEPGRSRRLAEVRAADPPLAARVAELLAADAAATGFLDQPTVDLLGAYGAAADGAADADLEPQLPAGSIVGPWRVVSLLGRGGMGEVYLAERNDPGFVQRVALKIVKRGMDSQAIVRRFMRERQILSNLDHPNIARLVDGGSGPDGRPYFALEYVDGEPINAFCTHRDLDLGGRLRLMQTVCQAVDRAHRRLVVHRDLKPDNILVAADGAVKLLDFGIAKLLEDDDVDAVALTRAGAAVLTPAYAAPEQILGEPISTATDVYALGVLLFQLITGVLPHQRDRPLGALATAVQHETAERPSVTLRRTGDRARLSRQVAGDLDLIVLTALHRDPARRYASAQALADDLAAYLAGHPIHARPDHYGYRMRKFMSRHRVSVAAVAVGLLALVAGLCLSIWQTHVARLAGLRAAAEAQRAERVKSFLISVFRQSDPDVGDGATLTARELLERGAATVETDLAGEPLTEADLLEAVARIEDNLGLSVPALAHGRRALALRLSILPPTDGRVGLAHVTLGAVDIGRGAEAEARAEFTQALSVLIPAYGADSIEVAAARRGLADSLTQPENRGRAVALLNQALVVFERRLGPNHVDTIDALHELGQALEMDQEYGAAEAAYRRGAVLAKKSLGPHSLKAAAIETDLAGLLDRVGRAEEARPLFERSIASEQTALGPHNIRVADTLFSYAVLLIEEEEYAGADKALTQALGIFGPDRRDAGHCLRYLGISALGQERFADAAAYFNRAIASYRRNLGENNPEMWRASANLGWAHYKMGRTAQGRQELATAVARIEALSGPDVYSLRLPLQQYGEVLAATGDAAHAVEVLQRDRQLDLKLFGTQEHHEVAEVDLELARALLARGAPGDVGGSGAARHYLNEGLGIFARVHPHAVQRAESLVLRGSLSLAAGDRAQAREDLNVALPLLISRKGAAHPKTVQARNLLAAANGG